MLFRDVVFWNSEIVKGSVVFRERTLNKQNINRKQSEQMWDFNKVIENNKLWGNTA